MGSTQIKAIIFEDASLTHLVTGADGVATPVDLITTGTLKGGYSASIPNSATGNLFENLAADELYSSPSGHCLGWLWSAPDCRLARSTSELDVEVRSTMCRPAWTWRA